jgi:hypothetical protein
MGEKDTKDENGFNVQFFKRFWRIQHLLFPGFLSIAFGLFFLLMLLALLGITSLYNYFIKR